MLRGYITNYGKYNEGQLIGKWIDFPISKDELEEVKKSIGINEQYEEWFFTDWESDICDPQLGECEDIDDINELAKDLEMENSEIIAAIVEATKVDIIQALNMVDDVVFYENMTLEDVAYNLMEECYELPEIAQRYFDYAAFARDLGFDGYTEVSNGVIYRG